MSYKPQAKDRPRFKHRMDREHYDITTERLNKIQKKLQQSGEYKKIKLESIFNEAIYRGLEYLESIDLIPEHDEGWFEIRFIPKGK